MRIEKENQKYIMNKSLKRRLSDNISPYKQNLDSQLQTSINVNIAHKSLFSKMPSYKTRHQTCNS